MKGPRGRCRNVGLRISVRLQDSNDPSPKYPAATISRQLCMWPQFFRTVEWINYVLKFDFRRQTGEINLLFSTGSEIAVTKSTGCVTTDEGGSCGRIEVVDLIYRRDQRYCDAR